MWWQGEQLQRSLRTKPHRVRGHTYAAHPELRIGSFFPKDELARFQRVDRALVNAAAKMCATGEFFSWLKGRGLSGVRLVTGD